MYYGGDYYPEQWPEETWPDDVRLMQESRVNLVSLGVFAWARIQRDEGLFDFDWLDRAIDLLSDHGVAVNLATATASPPHWATRKYPAMLPVTADGVRLHPGSRQHYAPTSPDYRRLAAELVTRLAERYAQHQGVVMWHINNEYACHVHYDYSENAARAFRTWLRDRYGNVDALNAAWGTSFWSQTFRSFDEILPPRTTPTSPNPAGVLDFRRFTSDAVLELYRMERDIIRAAGATQPITTNFMGAFPPMDYWRWAAEVDVVADDSYPDPRDPESFRAAAFTRDLMRSLKPGTPWILMEQATDAVNWRPNNKQKRPGQMAALSEQAVARGAGGIMFFQWRQSTSGAEKFHSAMLPHSLHDSRIRQEVNQLGLSLSTREADPCAPADVALILDWENGWALDQPDHPARFDYLDVINTWYYALHERHIQADIVHPGSDLSEYRIVIAPALYLLSDASADNLRAFVATGGVLVTTPFVDIVNENDRFLPGGFTMRLRDVFGAEVVAFDGIAATDGVAAELDGVRFDATILREEVLITSGDVSGITTEGHPAVVENAYERGYSYHTTVFPSRDGASAVLYRALQRAEVTPVAAEIPTTVEAIRTLNGITLINHSDQPAELRLGDEEVHLKPWAVTKTSTAAWTRTSTEVH